VNQRALVLGLGALGLAGLVAWVVWPKRKGLSGLGNGHQIQQSTRFYEKKYGISAEDARKLVTSPRRKKIEHDIEEWRSQYGYPESSSPLVRGYARDKIRTLAGPSMLRLIASESKTPQEYARRADAWASAEAKPPALATIAKAYRKASPGEIMRLLRQAKTERLAHTQARWRGYVAQPDEPEDLID
jgi:hypothetical protein